MKLPYLRRSEDLLRKTESERENIVWEWKELQRFLRDQEELLLRQLEELEKDIIARRDEHLSRNGHGRAGRGKGEKSLKGATKGRKNGALSKCQRDFQEVECRFNRFLRKRVELREVLCTFKELLKLEMEDEADEYVLPGAQEKSTGYFRFLQSCRRTGRELALSQQAQPVSFEEIAVCFSKAEWSLLGPSQRVLYKEVMQENYENVTSLVLSLTGLGPNSWMEEEDEAILGLRSQLSEKGDNQVVGIAASQEQEKSKKKGRMEKKKEKEKTEKEKEMEKSEKEKEKERKEKEKQQTEEKMEKEKEKEKEKKRTEKLEKGKEKMEKKKEKKKRQTEKEKEKEKENHPHPANVEEIVARGAFRKDTGLRPEEPTTYTQRKSERQREAGQKTRGEKSILSPVDRQNTSNVLLQLGISKGKKPKPCPKCGKEFNQSLLLLKHKQMHRRTTPYQCSDCGKVFSQRSHLAKHKKAHQKEKRFECSDCGKTFHRSSHFYSHQRTHRGIKPFKCSGCGKSYTRMPDLRRHQKSHTGEKSHKCFDCGKSFGLYSSLVKHERIHTGDKPYQCARCPKSFCQRTHLIVHQRTHTKDRPFKCLLCKAGFIQKAHLISHQRSHTGEKPFRCHSCGKSFKRNSTRVKHEKRHEKKSAEPVLPLGAPPSALPPSASLPRSASPTQRPSWKSRLRTVGRLGKAAA